MARPSGVDAVPCAQSVERPPRATDCLVVVAGVKAGGSVLESATPPTWQLGRGAAAWGCGYAPRELLAGPVFSGASDIVSNVLLELLQVNAWLLRSAV